MGGKVVAKVGRNDPCPCGSGKKYKHCCLRNETATKSEAISRDRTWDTMMGKLVEFSREARFRQDLESAFDLFWNKSYTAEQTDSLDPMQIMTFLDWYAHDYRTVEDGRRVVEIFLAERGSSLSEQELELLEGAMGSLVSAHEVSAVEEGKNIALLDVFQDLEYEMEHTPSLQGIKVGQLLVGRLVVVGDFRRFSWISMVVPPEFEADLKSYTGEMFTKYQEDHYQAPWSAFLRERSYLFNHFMLEVRGELPEPNIVLPYGKEQEEEPRPLVLTLDAAETRERPPVLVPGQSEEGSPPLVLVPGRDD